MSSLIPSNIQYNILNKGSRAAVGAGTRYIIGKGWEVVTKRKPPLNPISPGVQWSEALIWGAIVGLVGGMLGIVARRLTADAWKEYTGQLPDEPKA